MRLPNKLSYSEKYKLLKIIKLTKPTRWENIAQKYGWVGGLGGGLDGDNFQKYTMLGLQALNIDGLINVNIKDACTFEKLHLTPKGNIFLLFYYPLKVLYWILTVGIVSMAAIKTLFGSN